MNLNNAIGKKHCLAWAVAAVMAVPLAQAADVDISGFLSVGGGMVDDDTVVGYGGYDEEDLTFERNILGLQVSGQVNEKISATAQLISRTDKNDYETRAEWAYLTWQATDNSKVRMGRLRTPLYMYSDYLDVGYSYAWITAPQEIYYLPFNNVDGIDYFVNIPLGSFDSSFQAYFGGFEGDFELDEISANAKARNQMGVAATLGKDWWTLRAAYHQNELTVTLNDFVLNPEAPASFQLSFNTFAGMLAGSAYSENVTKLLVDEDKANFVELGINIDTGRFVAAAEHVEFEVDNSMLSKNVRSYVMGGVRFGDFLFHVTGSKTEDEIAHPEEGIPSGIADPNPVTGTSDFYIATLRGIAESRDNQRDVMTYGVRWDVTSGTALKLQLDDVDDELQGEQKVLSVAVQAVF